MARHFLRLTPIAGFFVALVITAGFSARSDSSSHATKPVYDASYRSRSSIHKVIVQANDNTLRESILAAGGRVVEDYGAFALMSAPSGAASKVAAQSAYDSTVRDDMNLLLLRAGAFDTTEPEPAAANALGDSDAAPEQLYLVQFIGPVKKQWVNRLKSVAEVVSYVPNNAYLVRASAEGISRVNGLEADGRSFVQWSGAFKPAYKIAPEIVLDSSDEIVALSSSILSSNGTCKERAQASKSSVNAITGLLLPVFTRRTGSPINSQRWTVLTP